MLVNYLVIFLIIILGVHYNFRKKNPDFNQNRLKFITLVSIILILQSGLRHVAVGADTYAYYLKFEEVKNYSWKYVFEFFVDYYDKDIGKDPGYLIFQKIAQIFISDYQLFLFLIALIFFSALGNFIYKNTYRLNDAILAFIIYSVLFYSFFSITGHRQTIATACTLYSFELIKKRKLFWYVLVILLASTIHKSCLIFLPFYLSTYINKPKYIFYFTLLLFPFLIVSSSQLVLFFTSIGGYDNYEALDNAGAYTFTFMFILIYLGAMLRYKQIIQDYGNNAKYLFVAFSIALLFIPTTWYRSDGMRVVQYFSLFMLILIPEIIDSFKNNRLRREIFIVSIALLTIYLYKTTSKIPYSFFWQEMELGSNYDI